MEIFFFGEYIGVVLKDGNFELPVDAFQHCAAARSAAAVQQQAGDFPTRLETLYFPVHPPFIVFFHSFRLPLDFVLFYHKSKIFKRQ